MANKIIEILFSALPPDIEDRFATEDDILVIVANVQNTCNFIDREEYNIGHMALQLNAVLFDKIKTFDFHLESSHEMEVMR